MKREIKFRAWHKKDKVMVDVASINFWPDGVLSVLEDVDDAEPHLADSYELMEYTGLHDKNGRSIYEGDIVDAGIEDQDGNPLFARVCYEKYVAGYVINSEANGIWQRLTKYCEVIGNIFENPELLEGKQ